MSSSTPDVLHAQWFTSSHSNDQGGNCVAGARLGSGPSGVMAVRDSKDPEGPVFVFGGGAWDAFVSSVKSGGLS